MAALHDRRAARRYDTTALGSRLSVAEAPPQQPSTLTHDKLLGLFKASDVGRDVELQRATIEDMCGPQASAKPSLEVIYDNV